jgi:hypothetical protein
MMALNRAANHLKIKSIEYQHSQQSDEHFAYAPWKNIELYSEFFPNTFWLWKKSDADRILRNFSSSKYIPNVIVGGNLSVIQQKEEFNYKASEAHKGILVSLQGIWIPGFLEEIIARDTEHFWYFRLHPRYPEDKQKLIDFRNKFPGKIEMDLANSLSLYELFTKVSISVTDFSGVALEAQEFGVKNIIIGKRGSEVYKQEIGEGSFHCALTETDFMEHLNLFSQQNYNVLINTEREKLNRIISDL